MLAVLLVFCAGGPDAAAQAIVVEARVEQAAAAQPPADVVVDDVVIEEGEQQVPAQVIMLNNEQFDMWVFGNSGMGGPGAGRTKLETLLDLNVDEVARLCNLSDDRRRKLTLAGRGDIKRFFDQVEEKRKRFDKLKADQNKLGELYQEIIPLQATLNAGLFGDGSLYAKTLKRVLEGTDESRYQEVLREKNLFRHRAKVELVVAQLDQSLGLSDHQRKSLVDVILRETRPAARYGQYAYYLVLYQASKIPREKLRPLFDEKQWAFFVRTLDSTRGMEQFLRQQGFLTAQDDAPEFARALREPPGRQVDLPAEVFAEAGKPDGATDTDRRTLKKD